MRDRGDDARKQNGIAHRHNNESVAGNLNRWIRRGGGAGLDAGAALSDDMAISSIGFGEPQADATVRGEAANGVAARRQSNATLETALRQFEAEDAGIAEFGGQHAASTDHERSLFEFGFDLVRDRRRAER